MSREILDNFTVLPEAVTIDPPRDLSDITFEIHEHVIPILPPPYQDRVRDKRLTFPVFVDNTMAETYSLCKFKGFMAHGRNIVPMARSKDLHFGGAMAKGLEATRLAYYGDGKSADESVELGLVALWKEWGDYVNPDPKSSKTLDRLECALISYFIEYQLDKDCLIPYMPGGKPAVEFTFAVPIPGTRHPQTGEPILYVGKFDMLGVYQSDAFRDLLFVDDEKTSTSLGPTWMDQWDISGQLTGYIWAVKQADYPPIAGGIVRGIGVLKGEIKHAQKLTLRSEWELSRWLATLRRRIDEMIECWGNDLWPQALNAVCNMYSGCAYRPLCTKQNPEAWLTGNYMHRVWDPLSKE